MIQIYNLLIYYFRQLAYFQLSAIRNNFTMNSLFWRAFNICLGLSVGQLPKSGSAESKVLHILYFGKYCQIVLQREHKVKQRTMYPLSLTICLKHKNKKYITWRNHTFFHMALIFFKKWELQLQNHYPSQHQRSWLNSHLNITQTLTFPAMTCLISKPVF